MSFTKQSTLFTECLIYIPNIYIYRYSEKERTMGQIKESVGEEQALTEGKRLVGSDDEKLLAGENRRKDKWADENKNQKGNKSNK